MKLLHFIKTWIKRNQYIPSFEYIPKDNYHQYYHLYAPVAMNSNELQNTVLIPLEKDLNVIFLGFTKNLRYEINRAAKKDHYEYVHIKNPDVKTLDHFLEIYRQFYITKRLDIRNIDEFYTQELRKRLKEGILEFSRIWDENKGIDIWHVYTNEASGRIRLTCSAALYRIYDKEIQEINARLNKLLHWKDISKLKEEGYLLYDFGGVNKNDPVVKSVGEFKTHFAKYNEKRYHILKSKKMKNKPQIRIKVRGGALYIAFEIVNQLSDEYICYIDDINGENDSIGGKSVICLPDDIRNKNLIGVNPFTFYCSKILDGDFVYCAYKDICSIEAKQRNIVLNNYDAVILDVNETMDIVHMMECAATGIFVLVRSICESYLEYVKELIMGIDNIFIVCDDKNVSEMLNNLKYNIINLRKQRVIFSSRILNLYNWEKIITENYLIKSSEKNSE